MKANCQIYCFFPSIHWKALEVEQYIWAFVCLHLFHLLPSTFSWDRLRRSTMLMCVFEWKQKGKVEEESIHVGNFIILCLNATSYTSMPRLCIDDSINISANTQQTCGETRFGNHMWSIPNAMWKWKWTK